MIRPRVSVGALLDAVGPAVLSAIVTPGGRGVQLGPPVIDDGQLTVRQAGSTTILIGRPSAAEIQRAAHNGAAAVIVRATASDGDTLAGAGQDAQIAVLAASEDLPWGEVYSVVRTVFTVYEPSEAGSQDLFELADWVAREAGGAVAIEDMEMRVVAYSSLASQDIDDLRLAGILGRRVPQYAIQTEEYLAVLRADGALWCVEPHDNAPRLAIGVHAHKQPYGTIWVVQGKTPLSARAPEILAEAARQAVPELAKSVLAADASRHRRNERVGRLLRGIGPREYVANELGLPTRGHFCVIAFGALESPVDELDTALVADLIRNAFASYRIVAAVGVHDGHGYAIVAGQPDVSLLDTIVRECLSQASDRHGAVWRAGISRTLAAVDLLTEGATQAKEVLVALSNTEGTEPKVAHHQDMSGVLFLQAISVCGSAAPLMQGEPIATVLAHDAAHATEYVKTLNAWVRTHYDVAAAADVLCLHPNTMRHRLNRVRELIALDDPDLRLVLALQLRLHCPDGS